MKGNQEIIDTLNSLLAGELSAMDQYFVHGLMYEDWGLNQLHAQISHESEDERGHAKLLIQRILFLEGTPDLKTRQALTIGKTPIEMLQNDLEYEYMIADHLRQAIQLCEQKQDFQTRDILTTLLIDTESDHMYWLEKQLGLIEKMGIEDYLESKM